MGATFKFGDTPIPPLVAIQQRVQYQYEFTPEAARWVLDNLNRENFRKLNKNTAELYAADMLRGEWCEDSPEVVCFSDDGFLLDGQHRLKAVVLAMKPTKLWVMGDIPKAVREFLNQGRNRTLQELSGKKSENTNTARMLYRLIKKQWDVGKRTTYHGIKPLMFEIDWAVAAVKEKLQGSRTSKRTSAPVYAAMVYNLLTARSTGEKAKVLDLIKSWCNHDGYPLTQLQNAFIDMMREDFENGSPSGQSDRMDLFLIALEMFSPTGNHQRGQLEFSKAKVNVVQRERIRGYLVGALGDVGLDLAKDSGAVV